MGKGLHKKMAVQEKGGRHSMLKHGGITPGYTKDRARFSWERPVFRPSFRNSAQYRGEFLFFARFSGRVSRGCPLRAGEDLFSASLAESEQGAGFTFRTPKLSTRNGRLGTRNRLLGLSPLFTGNVINGLYSEICKPSLADDDVRRLHGFPAATVQCSIGRAAMTVSSGGPIGTRVDRPP